MSDTYFLKSAKGVIIQGQQEKASKGHSLPREHRGGTGQTGQGIKKKRMSKGHLLPARETSKDGERKHISKGYSLSKECRGRVKIRQWNNERGEGCQGTLTD
jgi:hypothetical protein